MNVDFTHPANAKVLRFLRNPYDCISGPESPAIRAARERDLANGLVKNSQSPESINWLRLGTHPDVVERLWRVLAALLPEPCNWVVYGSPALIHPRTGVIFGWAGGTHDYTLRLPDRLRENPKSGPTVHVYGNGTKLDLALLGEEWVFGDWHEGEEALCLRAYDQAGV